jgi:uncharacterized protein (TIGR02186 family)
VTALVRALVATLVVGGTAAPAAAESLVIALSSHRVIIRSNFTGTDVVLFGAIERDASTVARPGAMDVVVRVRGEAGEIVARRKAPLFGLWLNADKRTFRGVPAYQAVLSNRPLGQITDSGEQQRLGLGLRTSLPVPVEGESGGQFRDAVVRLKAEIGLWTQDPAGVEFIAPGLFRATIPLPANVPFGFFDVEALLFSNGVPIARQTTALEVAKSGFEDRVASLSRNDPWLYGASSAGLAILCGWLASVAFRRA